MVCNLGDCIMGVYTHITVGRFVVCSSVKAGGPYTSLLTYFVSGNES